MPSRHQTRATNHSPNATRRPAPTPFMTDQGAGDIWTLLLLLALADLLGEIAAVAITAFVLGTAKDTAAVPHRTPER